MITLSLNTPKPPLLRLLPDFFAASTTFTVDFKFSSVVTIATVSNEFT
jgi:hypothetical protein